MWTLFVAQLQWRNAEQLPVTRNRKNEREGQEDMEMEKRRTDVALLDLALPYAVTGLT